MEIEVHESAIFEKWLLELRDLVAKRRILQRIARLQVGLLGDTKSLGGGLHELRIAHGPGYRVYYTHQGQAIVLLLCGGDKGSQSRDVDRARAMMNDLEN